MNSKKRAGISTVICLLSLVLLFAADQYTKLLAVRHLKDQPPLELIHGVLELRYLENRGAAFGMLQNQYGFFAVMTILWLVLIGYLFCRMPKTAKYYPLMSVMVLLTAGAIGNFYDRILNQYVVDFIYVSLIDFPIFNLADIFVVISVALFLVLYLWYYQEGDFEFIQRKKKKEE